MIFRDKKTGALLNLRRDEYVNDRMYFQEMMRVVSNNSSSSTSSSTSKDKPQLRYTRPFHELQSQNNYT
jgi:hypothetical protein